MLFPEQIDVAPRGDMDPQHNNGDNTNMTKFLDDAMQKLDDGSLNRNPWNHDDNFGYQFSWYMMANRAKYYIQQVGDIYNKGNKKHTVMLTFVDQDHQWTAENTKAYRNVPVESSLVFASKNHMKNLAKDKDLFFKRNWGTDKCDFAFYDQIREKICADVKKFEEDNEEDSRGDVTRKRRELAKKLKIEVEMNEKMQREKRAGRYSLEFADDWETADEDVLDMLDF